MIYLCAKISGLRPAKKSPAPIAVALLLCLFWVVSLDAFAAEAPPVSRELHWAVTREKFELALERLRIKEKAPPPSPVVLCHGLFADSRFLNLEEDMSLARFLAKEGFDVWNLSLRGTGRSLNPLQWGSKSWNLDDVIDNDVAAVIRYVQKETGKARLLWVGYEMGGMLLYGYLEKKGASGLAGLVTIGAPVTFNQPEQEPIKRLLGLAERPWLKKIVLYLNWPVLGRLLIPLVPKVEELFYNRENIEEGIQEKLLEQSLVEIHPGVLDHLLSIIRRGEFVSAGGDFSYAEHLSKIQLPLLLIGGEGDKLAPPATIRAVYQKVRSEDRTLRIFGPGSKDSLAYGHFDLILGKKAKEEVYPVIGRWLKRREESR